MRMEAGLDTGPVLLDKRVSIHDGETAGALTERLARLGGEAVVEALANLETFVPRAQEPSLATYATKISKSEAVLDWALPAVELVRRVRAFNPAPGAETVLAGHPLKIWEARAVAGQGPPGSVLVAGPGQLRIACGSGALEVVSLQRAGARRMSPAEFLPGNPVESGSLVGV
jgi:methionyl-tRNA formyltransferase